MTPDEVRSRLARIKSQSGPDESVLISHDDKDWLCDQLESALHAPTERDRFNEGVEAAAKDIRKRFNAMSDDDLDNHSWQSFTNLVIKWIRALKTAPAPTTTSLPDASPERISDVATEGGVSGSAPRSLTPAEVESISAYYRKHRGEPQPSPSEALRELLEAGDALLAALNAPRSPGGIDRKIDAKYRWEKAKAVAGGGA